MKFRECSTWGVLWVVELFPAHLKQLPAGDVYNMRSGDVTKEGNVAVDRVLATHLTGKTIQMLTVQLSSDTAIGWQHFKEQIALGVQPD